MVSSGDNREVMNWNWNSENVLPRHEERRRASKQITLRHGSNR